MSVPPLPPFAVVAAGGRAHPRQGAPLAAARVAAVVDRRPRRSSPRRRVKVGDVALHRPGPAAQGGRGRRAARKARPPPAEPRHPEGLVVRHLDDHVVVVEKPAGINTVRHPAELEWPDKRRQLDPTLQDLTQWAIAQRLNRPAAVAAAAADRPPARQGDERAGRLRPVGPGGAGTRACSSASTPSSAATSPSCPGYLTPQTIRSNLVRDRGDGRRGSTHPAGRRQGRGHARRGRGEAAGLHAAVVPAGDRADAPDPHPPVGGRAPGLRRQGVHAQADRRGDRRTRAAPRGWPCTRPNSASSTRSTGEHLHWTMPLPADLAKFVERLARRARTACRRSYGTQRVPYFFNSYALILRSSVERSMPQDLRRLALVPVGVLAASRRMCRFSISSSDTGSYAAAGRRAGPPAPATTARCRPRRASGRCPGPPPARRRCAARGRCPASGSPPSSPAPPA